MIFRATWKLVVRGKKTETRRPLQRAPRSAWVTSGDGSRRRRPPARVIQVDGQLYRACLYQVGHTYSVQPGRGKSGEARIVVTAVRRERVGDIDFAAARAEGFRTTADFKIAWVRIHDAAWIDREGIDRYAEELEEYGDDVVEWLLLERFRQRHADTLVWVIAFALERDVPRLLAPAAASAGEYDPANPEARLAVPGGYTVQTSRALGDIAAPQTSPLTTAPGIDASLPHPSPRCTCRICRATASSTEQHVPEPEPVDEATLARFAADAAERRAGEPGRREDDLRQRARSLAKRLRQEADADVKSGVDVITELGQIETQLKMLERGRDAA